MKCISLWEPWATLWTLGEKKFETRHWEPSPGDLPIDGRILVHAAKRWTGDSVETVLSDPFKSILKEAWASWGGGLQQRTPRQMPRPGTLGKIIGSVRIKDIWQMIDSGGYLSVIGRNEQLTVDEKEYAFGDFGIGRFAWEAVRPLQFPEPIPFTGHQGFFDVPGELVGEQLAKAKAKSRAA